MFSIEHLNDLRAYELEFYLPYLKKNKKILELGGGTGEQAKQLMKNGFDVISIDLKNSTYSDDRVFPVIDYNGTNIPLEDNSIDIIFSSNVLEHIPHINSFHQELKRVLKKDGYCIHIMPSGAWRFWTSVANYVELFQRLFLEIFNTIKNIKSLRSLIFLPFSITKKIYNLLKAYYIPPRHGEEGNSFSEVYTFSKKKWVMHFKDNDYKIHEVRPLELFYTGHMVLGSYFSMSLRQKFSMLLGSACVLYKVSAEGES